MDENQHILSMHGKSSVGMKAGHLLSQSWHQRCLHCYWQKKYACAAKNKENGINVNNIERRRSAWQRVLDGRRDPMA